VLAHPYGAGEIQAFGLFLRSRSDIAVLVCIGRNSQPRESVFEIISRMAKHICRKETLPTVYIYIMVSRKRTNTKQIAVFSEVFFSPSYSLKIKVLAAESHSITAKIRPILTRCDLTPYTII
jgi:hypothetical protein